MKLNFKIGSSLSNLQNTSKEKGTLYFLSGLNEAYVDTQSDTRIKIVDTDAMIYDTEESIQLETTLLILGSGLINYSNLK